MNSLHLLADVTHVLPFHTYDDEKKLPARCDLVVNPEQGWAVATELEGGGGLAQCHVTLARMICKQYNISPEALFLFTRYVFGTTYESIYAVRFAIGERDLFEDIRFTGPRRDVVNPEQATELVQALSTGQAPPACWRAVAAAPAPKAAASKVK